MRNLKKILALALALVMTMSLLTVANAFSDSDTIATDYQEAATVLETLNVYKGQKATDGTVTFQPKADITRAEVAAIIYRIVTGDVNDEQVSIYADYNKFTDVPSSAWYAGYVNFCANANLIVGVGNNTFKPYDNINGYSALVMILRAIGYGQNKEFEGDGWYLRAASTAQGLNMLANVNAGTLGVNATRELVAEVIFRGMIVPTVTYTPALGYSQFTTIGGSTYNDSLGFKTFGLKAGSTDDVDDWGRPSKVWLWGKPVANKKITVNTFAPVATYTTAVDECDIYADAGLTEQTNTISRCYIDGILYSGPARNSDNTVNNYPITSDQVTSDGGEKIDRYGTTAVVGAQGRVTEVYLIENAVWLVEINTYLAQVTKVNEQTTDRNGHVTPRNVELQIWDADRDTSVRSGSGRVDEHNYGTDVVSYPWFGWNAQNTTINRENDTPVLLTATVETEDYSAGEYVLVNMLQDEIYGVNKDGVRTAYWNSTTNAINAGWDHWAAEKVVITAAATLGAGGIITDWTDEGVTAQDGPFPATTVINNSKDSTYNDSDKFFAGWRYTGSQSRVAYLDTYGNIIGFVAPDQNWLVISAAEWKHGAGIGGGWVLADVMLADGTQVKDVTIASVDGENCVNTGDAIPGSVDVKDAKFSDDYTNNGVYYGHVFSYYVGVDGRYHLEQHPTAKSGSGAATTNIENTTDHVVGGMDVVHNTGSKNGAVYSGVATISTGAVGTADVNYVVANDATVFLVWNAKTYSYTVYKGIDNVPTYTQADLCILRNVRTGYAALVVIDGLVQNITTAYVPSTSIPAGGLNAGDSIRVYPVGTNRATTIRNLDAAGAAAITTAGMYQFRDGTAAGTMTAENLVLDSTLESTATTYSPFTVANNYSDGLFYDRTVVSADWQTGTQAANSFKTYDSLNAVAKDFRVTNETKVIIVENGTLTVGRLTDIEKGANVIVGYSATVASVVPSTVYRTVAQYVYVLKQTVSTVRVNAVYEIFDDTTGAAVRFQISSGNVATAGAAKMTVYTCNDSTKVGAIPVYSGLNLLADVISGNQFVLSRQTSLSQGQFYYVVLEGISGTTDDGRTFALDRYESIVYQCQGAI